METKQNWLSIAAVILVVAGLGVFLYRQSRQNMPVEENPSGSQEVTERANELLNSLNITLPENAQRADLSDVSGGDSVGVVTRTEESGQTVQSILVALPEPQPGQFYEAYSLGSEEGAQPTYLGRLRVMKGGWLLETSLDEASQNSHKIQVTRETVDDHKPETVILEGEFTPATEQD